MRFSKIITAGILILTFMYVNTIQNKILATLEGVSNDEILAVFSPVAIDTKTETSCTAISAPQCPEVEKGIDEVPLLILKKIKLSPKVCSLFYPFTKILTLSNPELPDCGSKANTSIS